MDVRQPPVLNELTGDQRFFLASAQVCRSKWLTDALRNQILTDPHSPWEFRVNGVVRNAWYQAFDVKPTDKLYLPPAERVHIG
jgi:putative endopeptidase